MCLFNVGKVIVNIDVIISHVMGNERKEEMWVLLAEAGGSKV